MQTLTPMSELISDEIKQKISEARKSVPGDKTHLQLKVEAYNELTGDLRYIDCPECKNKGYIAVIDSEGQEAMRECGCMKTRRLYHNLERSGLKGVYERYKLENFKDTEAWQTEILCKAKAYIQSVMSGRNFWLYVGGQRGSGKSHICTAVSGRLIALGKTVLFKLWQEIASEYKAKTYRDDERRDFLHKLYSCDVLFIDDFLKCRSRNDIDYNYDLAFQILNARYNSRKPTVISSELTVSDLAREDSAVSGRIIEMADKGEYALSIGNDPEKDMRVKRS